MTSAIQTSRAPVRSKPRRVKPVCVAVMARVVSVHNVSPNLVRVTLTAPEFAGMTFRGSDHYLRLLLPRTGQDAPTLPASEHWWQEMLEMAPAERPILRNYTVRDLRPDETQLDIDFVSHGDTGPATRWVNRAAIGDRVGIIDQGVLHEIDHTATDYLLVGDETALPAAAGILADLGPHVRVRALLEVPSAGDRIELPTRAQAQIDYLVRPADVTPGALILDALHTLKTPADATAWVAGESTMITSVRRHLVRTAGLAKSAVTFHGYFKYGQPQYDD